MANPQKENGYVPIANELMREMLRRNFSGSEWAIMMAVMMQTYGWRKKEDRISLSQFQGITGMTRPRVWRALKHLVRSNVLGSYAGDTRVASTYWIQKDYEKWNIPSNTGVTSYTYVTRGSTELGQKVVTPALPTKDNTKDKIYTADAAANAKSANAANGSKIGERFREIWGRYPKKLGKRDARRHFKATVKTEEDWVSINRALRNYKATREVREGYVKHGSTWFRNWEDYVDYEERGVGGKKGGIELYEHEL